MNTRKLMGIIIIAAIFLAAVFSIALEAGNKKEVAGYVYPTTRATQQQAVTTFDLYTNYTGGNPLTVNGVANFSVNGTNYTAYLAPADHRIVSRPEVYILRGLRINASDPTYGFGITLYESLDNGTSFNPLFSKNITIAGEMRAVDTFPVSTGTTGQIPLYLSGNSIVRLDMNFSKNVTVQMQVFGSG